MKLRFTHPGIKQLEPKARALSTLHAIWEPLFLYSLPQFDF